MSFFKPTTMLRLTAHFVLLSVLFTTSWAGFLDGKTRWGAKTFAAFKSYEMKAYESEFSGEGKIEQYRVWGSGHKCIGDHADAFACCVNNHWGRICSWSEGRCDSDDQCFGDLLCNKQCSEFRPNNPSILLSMFHQSGENLCCSMPVKKGVLVGTQERNCPKKYTKIYDREECLFATFALNLPIIYTDRHSTHIDDPEEVTNYIDNLNGKACRGVFDDNNAYYLCKPTGTVYK